MIKKKLNFFIENNTLIYLILTLINFLGYLIIGNLKVIEAFLLSFLTWNVGVRGLIACLANFIPKVSDKIAEAYNWPKGTSFQREIASAEGAFGLLGALCIFFREGFWTATIIGVCFCYFVSELGGLITIYKKSKDSKYRWKSKLHFGMLIDFVLSILLFICFLFWINSR